MIWRLLTRWSGRADSRLRHQKYVFQGASRASLPEVKARNNQYRGGIQGKKSFTWLSNSAKDFDGLENPAP